MASSGEPCFLMSVNGEIESAKFADLDNLYCRYAFHHGPDWETITGLDEGISQISRRSQDARQLIVWNLPLEIAFKSTNPYGWPQMIVSCYGPDLFGNDVVRGYGVCHLPVTSGNHRIRVPVFVPESASQLQKLASWFTGRRPELADPLSLAQGEGREVMRVRSQGEIWCRFQVLTKDLRRLGYDNKPRVASAGDPGDSVLTQALAGLNVSSHGDGR